MLAVSVHGPAVSGNHTKSESQLASSDRAFIIGQWLQTSLRPAAIARSRSGDVVGGALLAEHVRA